MNNIGGIAISFIIQTCILLFWKKDIKREENERDRVTSSFKREHEYRISLITILIYSGYLIILLNLLALFLPEFRMSISAIAMVQAGIGLMVLKSKLYL